MSEEVRSWNVVADDQLIELERARLESLDDLRSRLAEFARERDWDQFHNPKNLAMALSVEVAEISEY